MAPVDRIEKRHETTPNHDPAQNPYGSKYVNNNVGT